MIQSFSELQYKDSVNEFHVVDAIRSMVHSDKDIPVRLEAAIALQMLLKHQHSGMVPVSYTHLTLPTIYSV